MMMLAEKLPRSAAALIGMAFAINGCAIKPVPSDVVKLSTYGIVQQIRCEVRDAIRAVATKSISAYNPDLAKRLRAKPELFEGFDINSLDEKTASVLRRYDQGAIGYDFTFDITVNNSVSWDLNLFRGFSRGPLTVDTSASNALKRQNTRTFRNADTFLYLATQFPGRYCGKQPGANYQYPISGTIGLRETVATFISLNQSANLVGPDQTPDLPTMVDEIEFTTTVSGSLTPTVKLGSVGDSLQVVGTGGDLSASRVDRHKLIIGLTLPYDASDNRAPGQLIAVQRTLDAIEEQRIQSREDKKAELIEQIIE